MSGLASNPANREIASSSGASEHQDIFFSRFFFNFFSKKLENIRFKTVFAPESGMMRTFDKKNLGKTPPPFPHTPQKNLGRRVCVDRVEHIFCGASREFFFLNLRI
jgi:hypothetical protein